jgi:hypothetical protein
MKRSAFKRKHEPSFDREEHARARRERIANQRPPMTLHKGVIGGTTTALPKTEPKRNRALLDMAADRLCLLCPPGTCRCTPDSTVAAHSNLSIHGKAKARKADDHWSVWAGAEAHEWLDRSNAPSEVKKAAFMEAHARQIDAWRQVAEDPSEPERFRKAARWALEQLSTGLIDAVDAAERAML